MGAAPTREESRGAYVAALAVAISITHSKHKASDVVQEAFEKTMTTRPWDAGRVSFEDHILGVVRSLLSNEYRSAAARHERTAANGFHDEVVGRREPSLEQQLVEREELVQRDAAAETVLEQLAASVAHDDVAPAVLRCRKEGIDKPADIAEALGVPVDSVYRANRMLHHHLRRIREDDHG